MRQSRCIRRVYDSGHCSQLTIIWLLYNINHWLEQLKKCYSIPDTVNMWKTCLTCPCQQLVMQSPGLENAPDCKKWATTEYSDSHHNQDLCDHEARVTSWVTHCTFPLQNLLFSIQDWFYEVQSVDILCLPKSKIHVVNDFIQGSCLCGAVNMDLASTTSSQFTGSLLTKWYLKTGIFKVKTQGHNPFILAASWCCTVKYGHISCP